MKMRNFSFAMLLVFVLASGSVCLGVSIGRIDRVRSKGVLSNADLRVIDDFVEDAVEELFLSRDFTFISKLRTTILQRKNSSTQSAQAQYSEQFSESSYKYLSDVLARSEGLEPAIRKTSTMINLLILIDGLEDIRLVEPALSKVKNSNKLVCYWAVHAVTNESIVQELNDGGLGSVEQAGKILRELKGVIASCNSETLRLITEFASASKIGGTGLLLQVADVRISRHAGWSVDNGLLDAMILKQLYREMSSTGYSNVEAARRFGQLYSYVMQKYIMDISGGDFLTTKERNDLASVLVEVEKYCVSEILELPQSVIKTSIERGDSAGLEREYVRLFGDQRHAGKLSVKLDIDYGKGAGDVKQTVPLKLPEKRQG